MARGPTGGRRDQVTCCKYQPDGTTGVCQASSGSPPTIFSTESRWYCRKPRSIRDSSSRFTSPAGDAVSGVSSESAIVPVFRVGPSHVTTAQAPGTHRGNAAGGNDIDRHQVPDRVTESGSKLDRPPGAGACRRGGLLLHPHRRRPLPDDRRRILDAVNRPSGLRTNVAEVRL